MSRLRSLGVENMLAGGCVRDIFWNRGVVSGDYDLAFDGDLRYVVKSLLSLRYRLIPTGIKFGSIGVYTDGICYELTMLRSESNFTGHHRPGRVKRIRSWSMDASRRDLTYNACYYDGNRIIAFIESLMSLLHRHTKFMGKASDRLREDPLRWFRYVRFSCIYSKQSWSWFFKTFGQASRRLLPIERIYQEIEKMIIRSPCLCSRMIKKDKRHAIFGSAIQVPKNQFVIRVDGLESRLRMAILLFNSSLNFHRSMMLLGSPMRTYANVRKIRWRLGANRIKSLANLMQASNNKSEYILNLAKYLVLNTPQDVAYVWRLGIIIYHLPDHFKPSAGIPMAVKIARDKLKKWWITRTYLPTKAQCRKFYERWTK